METREQIDAGIAAMDQLIHKLAYDGSLTPPHRIRLLQAIADDIEISCDRDLIEGHIARLETGMRTIVDTNNDDASEPRTPTFKPELLGFNKLGWKRYESRDGRFALVLSNRTWIVYDGGQLVCRCWSLRDAKGIARKLVVEETKAED
jgi:hypothetical protein